MSGPSPRTEGTSAIPTGAEHRLAVADEDAAAEFYTRVLGMRAQGRVLAFDGQTVAFDAEGPAVLSLTTGRPRELVLAGLDLHGVEAERTAAGVHFRDPDGNLVEITFTHRDHPICGTALRAMR